MSTHAVRRFLTHLVLGTFLVSGGGLCWLDDSRDVAGRVLAADEAAGPDDMAAGTRAMIPRTCIACGPWFSTTSGLPISSPTVTE